MSLFVGLLAFAGLAAYIGTIVALILWVHPGAGYALAVGPFALAGMWMMGDALRSLRHPEEGFD